MGDKKVEKGLKILAKSSLVVLAGIVLAKIFSLAYRIIIARSLSPELYGLFSLALMVSGILVILSKVGLTGGVVRFIPFYRGKKRGDKARYVFRISFAVLFFTSIFMGILLFIFSKSIATGIFNNPELTFFLKIFSITIPLTIILDLFLSAITGFEKVGWHSFIYNILLNFVKVVSLIVLVVMGFKANAIVFSYLIGIAVSLVVAYFVVRSLIKTLKEKEPNEKERKSVLRELFSYSWPLLFFGFTWQVFHWTDSFLIGYLGSAAEVGFYNAAIPIAMLFNLTSTLFVQLFFPLVTRTYSEDKKNVSTIRELSKQVGKWIFFINLPLLLLILIFPGAFINILFGEKYLVAENALRLLAIGTLINSVFIVSDRLISMLGKSKIILVDIVVVSIVNVILNIIFIKMYGITGAALATMISFILLNLLFVIQSGYYIRIIPLRRRMFLIFLAGLISSGVVYYLKRFIIINVWSLGVLVVFFFLLYILLVFILGGLDKNDLMILKALKERVLKK